jgi:EAL domain-containing protein (putative c-di-GMP-specific phosphodiesterase class I)
VIPISRTNAWAHEPPTEIRLVKTDPHKLRIGSRFQPIVGLSHRRVVGHEALLVAADSAGRKIAPDAALASISDRAARISLEKSVLARHISTYQLGSRHVNNWLFLNFSTFFLTTCADGPRYLAELLDRYGLSGRQVVIEVLESEISDHMGFIKSLQGYRELGCLVAIDDFGSGHSNFDRVCDIAPDMVKLDRKLISKAGESYRGTHLLTRITQTLHEMGSLVLAEGIETEAEALAIMDAEADMAQGFYFSRPRSSAPVHDGLKAVIDDLWESYYAHDKAQADQTRCILQRYGSAMTSTSAKLASGFGFTPKALSSVQHLPGVMRLYLLDASGAQISQNLCAPECSSLDMRYGPLHDIHGATWYRRDYYRSAIAQPGHVHITDPYLSMCGNRSCVTLSLCFQSEDSIHVLCADIEWNQVKPSSR